MYWKAPFGYTRVPRHADRPAHLVINEAQAAVVRRIFADYTTGRLSLRKITQALNAEGVTTPSGRRWITSTLGRVLRRETYVGRLWVNRTKTVPGRAPGARPREVPRPKEEWIAVACPAIIDDATFAAAARACADNTNFSARRLNPDEQGWLLRGLVFCGCGARSIVDRGGSSQPGGIHYYSCRNRQGTWTGHDRTCLARNVRADGLDAFVFDQVRAALSSPEVLLAGEKAVAEREPAPDDELLAKELARLERRIEATTAERRRLADLYQAGVLGPDELAQRAKDIEGRRRQLSAQRDQLLAQRRELASGNRLRQRLEGFASRVLAAFDDLDFHQRQRLMRLLVERVQVRGWDVEIHLRIPLDEPQPQPRRVQVPSDDGPGGEARPDAAQPPAGRPGSSPATGSEHRVSSEERLRSISHRCGISVAEAVGPDFFTAKPDLAAVVGAQDERNAVRARPFLLWPAAR